MDKDDGKDEIKINTYETEEAEIAIAMLNVFIKEMKEFYVPYAERTINIILTIVKNMVNESIKQEALESLPLLVKLIKDNNAASGIAYAKSFLSILTEACFDEYDTDLLINELDCMKEIFDVIDSKFFDEAELKVYSEQIIKILVKSDERKNETHTLSAEELEDDEKELLADEIVMEEEVPVSISELIGVIFKTHKEMNLFLVNYIVKDILPKVFTNNLSDNMYKFGIFLIDDMIEFLGYGILHGIWLDFYNVFSRFCLHKSVTVRQASCYGLGIYAQSTPPDVFQAYIDKSLQLLHQAAEIVKGS